MRGIDGTRLAPELSAQERRARVLSAPHLFVGQERLPLSQAPMWTSRATTEPAALILRTFTVHGRGAYRPFAGGLATVTGEGGGVRATKDVWVLKASAAELDQGLDLAPIAIAGGCRPPHPGRWRTSSGRAAMRKRAEDLLRSSSRRVPRRIARHRGGGTRPHVARSPMRWRGSPNASPRSPTTNSARSFSTRTAPGPRRTRWPGSATLSRACATSSPTTPAGPRHRRPRRRNAPHRATPDLRDGGAHADRAPRPPRRDGEYDARRGLADDRDGTASRARTAGVRTSRRGRDRETRARCGARGAGGGSCPHPREP